MIQCNSGQCKVDGKFLVVPQMFENPFLNQFCMCFEKDAPIVWNRWPNKILASFLEHIYPSLFINLPSPEVLTEFLRNEFVLVTLTYFTGDEVILKLARNTFMLALPSISRSRLDGP